MQWLNCGGDIRWRNSNGTPLSELLEDSDARAFLRAQTSLGALARVTVTDWRTYAVPLAMVPVALGAVTLEQRVMPPPIVDDLDDGLFLDSARLLVGQHALRKPLPRRLWRWMEFHVAVFWFGLPLLVSNWSWWLPLVAFWYLAPAAMLYGAAGFCDPTLVLFTRSHASRAVALMRTVLLCGIFSIMVLGLHPIVPWVGSSWHSELLSPLVLDWQRKLLGEWASSSLKDSWLFSWAPPVTATTLFYALYACNALLVLLYVVCLFLTVAWDCSNGRSRQTNDDEDVDSELPEEIKLATQLCFIMLQGPERLPAPPGDFFELPYTIVVQGMWDYKIRLVIISAPTSWQSLFMILLSGLAFGILKHFPESVS